MSPIQTKELSRVFGKLKAVDRLCLNVPAGSIYGFLGVNGAGKTTTIKMLMGILRPSSGEISIMGNWERKVSVRSRRLLSYVSQEQFFYPWMKPHRLAKFVRAFYCNWDQNEFELLLKNFHIPENKTVEEMSGGMKTKLALALAMSSQPEVLILDEPTAGLDPAARREFMDLVVKQSREKGRTTFFSSHLVNEVEQCADIIGIIHYGKLLQEGKKSELMKQVCSVSGPPGNIGEFLPQDAVVLESEIPDDGNFPVKYIVKLPSGDRSSLLERIPGDYHISSICLEDIFLSHVAHQTLIP